MRKLAGLLIILAAAASLRAAEDLHLPVNMEQLAARATESVDVTLDQSMLQFASKFLSKDDPEEAQVKKVVSKLKGVYVRSFEFDKDGQYSLADVEAIRAQLKNPKWSRIVSTRSKTDNSEVYLQKEGDRVSGLVVISIEPKSLTVVHIDGPIDPDELSELSGRMGIPKIGSKEKRDGNRNPKPLKEEE